MTKYNSQAVHPAIVAQENFFNKLEEEVNKAGVGEDLRILYEKFGNYCINMKIGNSFGPYTFDDNKCDEKFRKELLSNIDMARSVCMSRRDGLSSGTNISFQNINQQHQVQNVDVVVKSLEDYFTISQLRELKEIIEKKGDNKETKIKIIEKLKSFGNDLAPNIVANLLTNPSIWAMIGM